MNGNRAYFWNFRFLFLKDLFLFLNILLFLHHFFLSNLVAKHFVVFLLFLRMSDEKKVNVELKRNKNVKDNEKIQIVSTSQIEDLLNDKRIYIIQLYYQ